MLNGSCKARRKRLRKRLRQSAQSNLRGGSYLYFGTGTIHQNTEDEPFRFDQDDTLDLILSSPLRYLWRSGDLVIHREETTPYVETIRSHWYPLYQWNDLALYRPLELYRQPLSSFSLEGVDRDIVVSVMPLDFDTRYLYYLQHCRAGDIVDDLQDLPDVSVDLACLRNNIPNPHTPVWTEGAYLLQSPLGEPVPLLDDQPRLGTIGILNGRVFFEGDAVQEQLEAEQQQWPANEIAIAT